MQKDIIRIIEMSFTKETCYPNLQDKWNSDNPSLGQCAVTALVVNDFLGGKIMRCESETGSHYYNLINNEVIDLTSGQFNSLPDYNTGEERSREYLLSNIDTKNRYKLLLENVKSSFIKYGQKEYKLVNSNGKNATVRLSGPETTKVGTNNPEPLITTENIWEPFEYPAVVKYKENQAKYAAEKAAGKSKKPYNKKPYNKDVKPGYRSDKPKFNNSEKKPYERKPYGDNKKPYTPREGRPKYNNRPDNSDRNYKRDYKQSNTSGENGYSRPYKNDAGNPSRPFKDAKSVGNKPPQKQQDFNKNGIRRLSSNDRMF